MQSSAGEFNFSLSVSTWEKLNQYLKTFCIYSKFKIIHIKLKRETLVFNDSSAIDFPFISLLFDTCWAPLPRLLGAYLYVAPLAWVQGTGSLSNECRASLQDTLGPFLGVSVALLSN